MSCFINLLGCFLPRSPSPTLAFDIVETPKSIKENRDKFDKLDVKIDGKAKVVLMGRKQQGDL